MGDNPTKAQIDRKREANKKAFGLSLTFVNNLKLPKAQTKEWLKVLTFEQIMRQASNFSVIEKIHHLRILEEALERKLNKIKYLESRNANNFKPCKIGIIVQKSLGSSAFDTVYEYVGTNTNLKSLKRDRTGHRYFNQVEEGLTQARATSAGTDETQTGSMLPIEELDEEEASEVEFY